MDQAEQAPAGPEAGWLSRTRRLRLGALLVLLGLSLVAWLAKRSGHLAYLQPAPFTGRLELEGGVVVEQVDLLDPAARLVVAKIPRDRGLGLRALLLDGGEQDLLRIGPSAAEAGALVAVNGDYHELSGFCFATTYSTLIDGGQARVVGDPFSYGAAFWIDAEGRPHVGRLDLRCRAILPSGEALPLRVNKDDVDVALIDRPPAGRWSGEGRVGVPVDGDLASGALTVSGPAATSWEGPALLVRPGSEHAARVRALKPGDTLRLELRGEQAEVPLAIGTGPRLLEGGEVHADARLDQQGWVARHFRSAVGFNDEHLFLVVTQQVGHGGLSMVALAEVMRALGCSEATNLDGGPSSSLWADGRVLNVPVPDGDAPVASALFVLPEGKGTPLR